MANFYYNEYPMYCELSNSKISEVYQCQPSPIEQELRNFYKAHPNIYEYKDMTFIYLNTKKDIEFKFISDFRKINQKENDNILKTKSLKLSGTITNFIHRANNVVVSCSFCGKRVDDSHFLNCCGIPKLSFKLIIDIKDCSGHMLLDLYGKNAENFLEMTPGEYRESTTNPSSGAFMSSWPSRRGAYMCMYPSQRAPVPRSSASRMPMVPYCKFAASRLNLPSP